MAATIGKLDNFDENVQDWSAYFEQVEQYFKANKVDDDLQVPALLSSMGASAYNLLKNLNAPAKPSAKSLAEINNVMTNHLNPKPLLIAERYRFYKRDQQANESVPQYIAILKKLSVNCDFGTFLDDALRDKLVCGLHEVHIQKRLLTMDQLTFDLACKTAYSMETAAKDASAFREKTIHAVQATEPAKCFRCGRSHNEADCWFKDSTCDKCGKKGHIKPVCRGRARYNKQREN